MNTITVSAHRRPFHLKLCLESIIRAQQWYPWANKISVCYTQHGDPAVRQVAESYGDHWFQVIAEPPEVGSNPHDAARWMLQSAFDIGSDCNLYVEDDAVLSPDAFMMLDWMQSFASTNPDILGACLYHETIPEHYKNSPPDPLMLHLGNGINTCGGTAFIREPTLKYILPKWNCKKVEPKGFDYSAHFLMYLHKLYVVWPDYSRSMNCGFTLGSIAQPMWAKYFGRSIWVQSYQAVRTPGTFYMDPDHRGPRPGPVLDEWMKPELRDMGVCL